MNILVLGSTGVLGRNVIPRLLERGHRVRAIVRRSEPAQFLQQAGVDVWIGDIFDLNSLDTASYGSQAILNLATAIPKGGNQDWSLNDRVRREGTQNILKAATKNGVKRYIQQSIALLYGERGQETVNESAPLQVTQLTLSAADMEEMVRASGLEWSILRGGLFYGPGTGREDEWWKAAREGRLLIPGNGRDLISLVHVVDMARAVVAVMEYASASTGQVYNIVDDEPARVSDLFQYVAAQVGKLPLTGGPRSLPSLAVSNVKAQLQLTWRPAYPNYRVGLAYGPVGYASDNGPQIMALSRAVERIGTAS